MKQSWWDVQAGATQAAVRQSQIDRAEEYTDDDARRSVVYTREDTVLVVTYLSILVGQLSTIKKLVQACAYSDDAARVFQP